ncbi:hypothetical protein, partial [Mesorhizobium mediterraneum]|uniref:hypothetical protein n=1 Tax=Mesorhizobium mediterraneum TaxID=43617 RepID=UPI001AED58D0
WAAAAWAAWVAWAAWTFNPAPISLQIRKGGSNAALFFGADPVGKKFGAREIFLEPTAAWVSAMEFRRRNRRPRI